MRNQGAGVIQSKKVRCFGGARGRRWGKKVLQLQFIDDDVRFVHYSTVHPRHDMSHLLKEVKKQLDMSTDPKPLICGVGLGGYWSERIGFLCGIRQVIFNPNLHPAENSGNCLCILSVQDEVRDNRDTERELKNYYDIVWDERETHKFKNISHHLQRMKAFKEA